MTFVQCARLTATILQSSKRLAANFEHSNNGKSTLSGHITHKKYFVQIKKKKKKTLIDNYIFLYKRVSSIFSNKILKYLLLTLCKLALNLTNKISNLSKNYFHSYIFFLVI